MSKNLNDIPNEFLENFNATKNKSSNTTSSNNNNKDFDVYISSNASAHNSTNNTISSTKINNNKDFIWIFVMMLILFDII